MKIVSSFVPVFTPSAAKLDFSAYTNFQFSRLMAVLNLSSASNQLIYAVGSPAYGTSSVTNGNIIVLDCNTSTMNATDPLMVIYDDGGSLPVLGPQLQSASLPITGSLEVLQGRSPLGVADAKTDEHLVEIWIEMRVMNNILAILANLQDNDLRGFRQEALQNYSTLS